MGHETWTVETRAMQYEMRNEPFVMPRRDGALYHPYTFRIRGWNHPSLSSLSSLFSLF